MQLLGEYLRKEVPLIQRNNIRMRFLGGPDELPDGVRKDTREATEATAGNTGMVLSIALNYGGGAGVVGAGEASLAGRKGNGGGGGGVGGRGLRGFSARTLPCGGVFCSRG